jgi:hypothetical protein
MTVSREQMPGSVFRQPQDRDQVQQSRRRTSCSLAALSADFAVLYSRMSRPVPLPSLTAEFGQDVVRIPDGQIGKRPPKQVGKVELAPLWM